MISMIVLTYGRENIVKELMRSFKESDFKFVSQVILVDNNSKPVFSKNEIASMGVDKYISMKRNLGVAGGRNEGLKFVTNQYVLYIDDDCILGNLDRIYQLVENKVDFGLINIQVEDSSGRMRANEIPRPKKNMVEDYERLEQAAYVIGACFIVSPSFAKQRFDESFNPYGFEEIEYSMRAISAETSVFNFIGSKTKHNKNEGGRSGDVSYDQMFKKFKIVGQYYPNYNQFFTVLAYILKNPTKFKAIFQGYVCGKRLRNKGSVNKIGRYLKSIGLRWKML